MQTPTPDAPLILTLELDEKSAAFFNELRRQHFPRERNYLDAHLTLFHHLPGHRFSEISEALALRCRAQPIIALAVTGVQFLGRGVAYALDSHELQQLHQELQAQWLPDLTPQDQQKRRPHVTIQNKVAPEVARLLYQQLTAEFAPFEALGTALQLWEYRGGPWKALRRFPLQELEN
ncbi:2'-5' RNA ligase family protein [Hymenobacter sp. BT491]|uniref:2'-5' RNA ligase family protein n=1 Tax=Hymenobacter sp. BT491 TaxID=2766779 RepID=UPI001653BE2C|nr:2'-5' RNA ligase family protein [Hymenobacter sp. BT491]MBC6988873.1 2'-5' RNA ligase family protein [Hymenobacter sp. BT491]